MHTTHSQPTMVRETRHLWVGNLPENIREERVTEHFKRYGKVQNVRIHSKSSTESNGTGPNVLNGGTMLCNGVSATVSFIDIKSAAKAHSSENKIEERTLKTDYYESKYYDEPAPATPTQTTTTTAAVAKSASSLLRTGSYAHVRSSEGGKLEASESPSGLSLSSTSSGTSSASVSSTVAAVAASSSTVAAASSSTSNASSAATSSGTTSSTTSQPSVSSTSASSSSSVSSAAASSSTSPATSLPSNAALFGRHTPSRISDDRHESRDRNSVNNLDSRDSSSYLKSRNISYHDDESPSYSSRNRSSRESSVSSRASYVGNATSSSSGTRNVTSSTGINNHPDNEGHGSNSSSAHEPVVNASSSHHGTSSVSYQNMPGASSSQDNLSSSSSHSNDRDELKTSSSSCSICVRNFPTRSTQSNLQDGLFHEYKKYGSIVSVKFYDEGVNRHAIVTFRKPEQAEKALNESKNKQFFGNQIDAVLYIDPAAEPNEENEPTTTLTSHKFAVDPSEIDEYHPRATRTLFVGNLDKDITKLDLTNKFSQFGEILEIDIKSTQHTPYAFIQFTDISSVVKAMRKFDGEPMGGTRLKCGFGKSFPSSCVWLCDNKDDSKDRAFADRDKVVSQLNRYGNIKNSISSADRKSWLIFFETCDEARKAIEDLHNKPINGRKVMVDFASRDFQNFFIGKHKSDDTHRAPRSSTSSWTGNSTGSLDYEDRAYESSRNRNPYHHHQSSSRSSSNSLSSQLLRSNSGTSSSYSTRQRSQSPSSSPATLSNFSRFSNSSGNGKSSKYDYHHESSSRTSSRPYRYENEDIDDVGEDSHLSSSSKRESSSSRYRSHHISENYISENSPKVRRDSSPYGPYGNSSNKSDADGFASSSRSARSSNLDDLKGHEDGSHGSLRRLNSHKSYHKSGRDSPPLPPTHSSFRKSGLASSSSSTSSNSRSPVRDSKATSYYLDRTSISPVTSPRTSGHSFHDGDTHNELSSHSVSKLDKDYNSLSSWRRKSTEESAYYRDYTSGEVPRNRNPESTPESLNDNAFAGTSSTRDHSREYYRSRESVLHRTNSSPSASLTYQNRSETLKRKHSTLESDDDSVLGTVQERKKRLMACIEPSLVPSSSGTNIINNNTSASLSMSASQTAPGPPATPLKSTTSVEPRLCPSKSLENVDVNGSRQSLGLRQQDTPFPPSTVETLKRRSSSSSSSGSLIPNSLGASSGNNGVIDLKTKKELKELLHNISSETDEGPFQIFQNLLQEGKSSAAAPAASVTRKPSISSGSSALTPTNGSAYKPKLDQGLKVVYLTSAMVNPEPDPRKVILETGHSSRKFSFSRTSCDNDLSKSKASDDLSSPPSSIYASNDAFTTHMIFRVPTFAKEYWNHKELVELGLISDSSLLSKSSSAVFASSNALTSLMTTATSTISTITPTTTFSTTTSATPGIATPSTSSLIHINIPPFTPTNTSPKSNNTIMSPLGSHSPVPKSRLSRDRLSTDTNSIDSKRPNDLDDVSDPEESPLRTSSIDDQIKALDEKIASAAVLTSFSSLRVEKAPTIDYSKYNIKKKSQTSANNTSTVQLNNSTESESSDIFKNLLSKSSVFDQDAKRLEHINESRKDNELENTLSSPKAKTAIPNFLRAKPTSSSGSKHESSSVSASIMNQISSSKSSASSIEKTTSEVSLLKTPTTSSTVSGTTTHSGTASTHHFNHQQQHHHHHISYNSTTTTSTTSTITTASSSSSSSSTAHPSLSSSMNRKLSDTSRVNSLKKESSLSGPTSTATPGTPSSAPVRSTSNSMFPQFHRSSSIPTTTNAPSTSATTTTTSSLSRNAFPSNKKENSHSALSNSSSSTNTTSGKSSSDGKSKTDLGSSSRSLVTNKDVNKKDSSGLIAASSSSSSSSSSKHEATASVRKDSITKHSAQKPDFFKTHKSESSSKPEIPASRKEHKHSGESDHTSNHVDGDHHREKSSGAEHSKHSNKDRDHKDEHKDHKSKSDASLHKSEKHKEKSNDGHSSMSNHGSKDKEKIERKMEKNLLKEKEKRKREKERQREKDLKESGSSKDKSKELSRQKTKVPERSEKKSHEKDKDKDKGRDKERGSEKEKEKKKYKKQKDFSINDELREMLMSIADSDEPYYFSMYDKVKQRSQRDHKASTTTGSEGKSPKTNQPKGKGIGKRNDTSNRYHSSDDSDDSDISDDSDSDNDLRTRGAKPAKHRQKSKNSDDEDDDEDEDDDGDEDSDNEDEDLIPSKKKKYRNVLRETDSEEESAKPSKEEEEPKRANKYAKKLLELSDSSSENEMKKATASTSSKKKNNKISKRDKERPSDIGSPVKEKIDKHDLHEKLNKEQEKERELQKIKKMKVERKEKEREAEVKRDVRADKEKEKEREKRPRSEDESHSAKMTKKNKKAIKEKSKEKGKDKDKPTFGSDGKSRTSEPTRRPLPFSSSDSSSDSSDSEEEIPMSIKKAASGHKTNLSSLEISSENRSHTILKPYTSNEKTHRHSDKDLLVSKEQFVKERDNNKVNNQMERHFATKEKAEKVIEKEKRIGDRSPTKKDVFLSSKIQKQHSHTKKEEESSNKELNRKRKKSAKNKDREKSRKDSESSDSKRSDKKDKDHRPNLLDSSSNEGEAILISPTRSSQPPPKTDFKSLLPNISASTAGILKATTPPKTPEAVSSSRSSSYTEDLGFVHRTCDDGSSSDSRLDEELINDARKLEEEMMTKNDDSYDSNSLSGSSSPLISSTKTLRQTDLSLLPQFVPSFSAECSNLDSNNITNIFTPASQRCYDEEAAIQSLKLQKELESKDSEQLHHHQIKPKTFESMPPFPLFSGNLDEQSVEELPATFTARNVLKVPSEDPTLPITAETECSTGKAISPQGELDNQRKTEDDLAVLALLQAECGTHDRSSIDQTHSEESFLNIFSNRNSSDGDRTESMLTAPSPQAIVVSNSTVLPSIIGAPEISVDEHELNAALQEIEVLCPQTEHKADQPVKDAPELMFNDEDDDEQTLTIVDENLEKSLADDSELRPSSQTEIKKPSTISTIGMTPTFGSMKSFGFESSICLPKPSTASIADIIKDSIKDSLKESAKLVDPLKTAELVKSTEEVTKPLERSEKRTIDLHMSMPILTSAFDTKIQSETVSIKERTRSTDSDKSEPMKSPFANFLSPRSVHSDTSLPEKKSTPHVIANELSFTDVLSAQLAEDKRDSCSESVVSDKTEIEEESVSELFNESINKASTSSDLPTVTVEETVPPASTTISDSKSVGVKLVSEESEPENESVPPKSKRGRKPKSRKLSDTSLHSPRSDVDLETHGQMASLSINTSNLTCSSGNLLLSPTSNSNTSSTTTTSDISPGSQAKRGAAKLQLQQQQQQLSYGIRRSVRSAAAAATVANSNTVLDLDDADLSLDEPPPPPSLTNREEPVEEETGGVKKSKRGRKKKNLGNVVEHIKIIEEDKSKKDKQLHVLNSTSGTENRPTKPDKFDVFEFRESDEDEPVSLTSHFLSSEDKRHPEPPPPQQQQHQTTFESCISPSKTATEVTVSASSAVPSAVHEASASAVSGNTGDNTSPVTGKEYVSEMNQHGKHGGMKMIIRLKDGQEDMTGTVEPTTVKPAKNLHIEDSKSNDGMSNSSTAGSILSDSTNSIKGVRKSARLMSQVPKTTVEDTIEDVIKTKAEERANASKRITRSYRKSDDTVSASHASSELSEESDDTKSTTRPYRVTRSRGATAATDLPEGSASTSALEASTANQSRSSGHHTPVTSPLPAARTPKKSTDSQEHTELLIPPQAQTPVSPVDVLSGSVTNSEESEIIEHQQPEEGTVQAVAVAKIATSSPTSNSAAECIMVEHSPPSVIHSTGNVEKVTAIQSITGAVSAVNTTTVTAISTAVISSLSPSIVSVSTMAATVGPPSTPQPVFSNSAITSPTYILQDIPNISERIHHSSTALKLKTGKGYFFEATSSMPISTSSVSTPLESPAIASITPITPSIISPPASSASPKSVTDTNLVSIAATLPSVSPLAGSQSITIKAKTQPPVGPSMTQLVAAPEMWPASTSMSKAPVCTVPSTATVHTPSPFSESSIDHSTGIVQPPLAHVAKHTVVTPPALASEAGKQGNMALGGVMTTHQPTVALTTSPINALSTPPIKSTTPSSKPPTSVVQPLLPPEIAAHYGAFPPHLIPTNPHQLAAEYMAANAAAVNAQQHLNIMQQQKQQQQQQVPSGNRTLPKSTDSRSSPGFASPAPHLPPTELQQQQAAFAAAGLPPHHRPPVTSATGQSPVFTPRSGFSGLSPEMDLLAQQQLYANICSQIPPELRQNGPNALSRHQLQTPISRGVYYPYGLSQEQALAELAKDPLKFQQMQHQHLQQQHQQQQSSSGKKDDSHHRPAQPIAEEPHKHQQPHHIVDPTFHLDPSAMPPPIGQRNMNFPGGIRLPFPFPGMTQPDRFVSPEASLMQSLYSMNGQGRPISAHNFASGVPNPTDLSKPGANQTSTTPEPMKRSTAPKPPVQADAAYLSQMHRQMTSPSGLSTTYRKDMPTVQEPSAELLRSQMASMNMTPSQMSQRPPSRTSSSVSQPSHPHLSRPSEPSPIAEQALVNRPLAGDIDLHITAGLNVDTPAVKTLRNEQIQQASQVQQTAAAAAAAAPAGGAPNSSNESIITKYPILWSGLLALKNDSVSVQMHFVSGNREISRRALPQFSEINMQPLRITQRMRLDQVQLTALERKIQANEDFCILLALPCGRDYHDVLFQSDNLKRFFINYMQVKQAAGIVNTNDQTCSYITHIIPSCQFSDEHLVGAAPDLMSSVAGMSQLMVVITANQQNGPNPVF